MVNARWLTCQHIWSGRIGNLWSARHSTEERGRVSRAHWHLKQHGLDQRDENRADFDSVKEVFFTLPLRNFNQSIL